MATTEDLTNLSPEQIEEILSWFLDSTRQRQYIGARYLPILGRKGEDTIEWDNGAPYEQLTIVMHNSDTYTSRCYVPTGAEITDTKYWARTANFNAQVEQYRQEAMHAVEVAEDAMEIVGSYSAITNADIDTIMESEHLDETSSKYLDETGLAHFWENIKDKYTEVVADYAGLLASTSDLVFVRNMSDGPFGINTSCLFKVTDASTSYIQRENGTYMMACANQAPLPPSNAPSVALGDCIASYVGRDTLSYGNVNVLFSETVENLIDCSSFVHACLYGITYENSRYALGSAAENVLGQYIGDNYLKETTIGERKHSLLTWQMAEWFAEQKRLFKFPETGDYRDAINMLSFGDVLFSSSGTYEDRIYGIDHCMIVLKIFDNGAILVAHCGGAGTPLISNNQSTACKTSIIDFANYFGAGKPFQVFARPCYGGTKDLPQNISAHMKSSGQVTSSAISGTPTLAIINCFQQLQPERAYTLLVKGKLPAYADMGAWLLGRVGGANVMRAYHINITSDFIAIPFIMPVGTSVGSFMQLMATEDAETSTGFTYEIEECGIVRGIVDSGNMSRPVNVTKNDSNANVTSLTNFSFIDGLGRFHLAFECMVGGTAGTTDENIVGYVQENYPFLNTSQLVKFPVFAGSTVIHVGAYNPSNGAITLTRVQPNSTVLGYTNRINVTLDGIPYNA